jgi:hypothetical protein
MIVSQPVNSTQSHSKNRAHVFALLEQVLEIETDDVRPLARLLRGISFQQVSLFSILVLGPTESTLIIGRSSTLI